MGFDVTKIVESKVSTVVKCISIFLLTIIIWHSYRFLTTYSTYKSYFVWETIQGYLFYFFFYILMFAILVFFVRYLDRSSLKDIGLSKAAKWKTLVLMGVSFAFLARLLEIGFGALAGGVIVTVSYSSLSVSLFFIVTTFFVGLSEEGIFRGYIQRKLTDAWKFLPALFVTSLLFKIYHLNFFTISINDLVLTILVVLPSFGVFAGYFYHKSRGNLLGPIALHMFYDLFGTIVPLGVDVTRVSRLLIGVSTILVWTILVITLRILADKTSSFNSTK